MPNMFGGDQYHPDYDPARKLEANESMKAGVLWRAIRVRNKWVFEGEHIDGSRVTTLSAPTPKLRRYVREQKRR